MATTDDTFVLPSQQTQSDDGFVLPSQQQSFTLPSQAASSFVLPSQSQKPDYLSQLRQLQAQPPASMLAQILPAMFEPTDEQRERAAQEVATHTPEVVGDDAPNLSKPSANDITTLTGLTGRTAQNVSTAASAPVGLAEGLVSSGLVGAPEKVAGQLGAGFVAQMAASVPQQLGAAAGHYSAGDTQSGDSALLNGLVTAAMIAVPAHLAGKADLSLSDVVGDQKAKQLRQSVVSSEASATPKPAADLSLTGTETPLPVPSRFPLPQTALDKLNQLSPNETTANRQVPQPQSPTSQGSSPIPASQRINLPQDVTSGQQSQEAVNSSATSPANEFLGSDDTKTPEQTKTPQIEPQSDLAPIASRDPTAHFDYSPADLQKYVKIKSDLKQMSDSGQIMEGDQFSPQWQATMAQFEALRNKYNGNPPQQLLLTDALKSNLQESPVQDAKEALGRADETQSSTPSLPAAQEQPTGLAKPVVGMSPTAEISKGNAKQSPTENTKNVPESPSVASAQSPRYISPQELLERQPKAAPSETVAAMESRSNVLKNRTIKQTGEQLNEEWKAQQKSESEHTSLGGALHSENLGDSSHGIAARVLENRATAGDIEPIQAGEGISPKESVERGRELLWAAKYPSASFDDLTANRPLDEKVAIARARSEQLQKAANDAYDKSGVDSPEYAAAKKVNQDWSEKTKTLATEASRAMVGHQGEVDLNTGDFHALRQAHLESTGHDFEPKQAEQAQVIADKSKEATNEAEGARKQLYDELDKTVGTKTTASDHIIKLAEKIVKKLDERADNSRKELAKIWGRTSAGIDPTIAGHLANIAASHIGHVGLDFAKWSDSMIKQFGEKARPYLNKAWELAQKRVENESSTPLPKQPATDVQKVWQHVKENYLNHGESDFGKIVNKTAVDLGMKVDEVRKLLSQPKGISKLTDEMYLKVKKQRDIQNQAKNWLKDQQKNTILLAAGKIPRALFNTAVAFHGTVGMITHAGNQMFYPPHAKLYWSNFIKQYPMAFGKGGIFHEKMMEDLQQRPLYAKALRSGLVVDPNKFSDDYQQPQLTKYFGGMGNRGFDALKLYRMDKFEDEWHALPKSIQTKEMGVLLANEINHSTGVVKAAIPKSLQTALTTAFFAPKLEASRWAWLIGDPAKAASTFSNWSKATAEDKADAISQVKKKAWVIGTYLGALAVNQGLLSATGSNQKVNFTDPTKPDWLSFKVAGHNVGIVSPVIGLIRFLGKEIRDLALPQTKFQKQLKESRLGNAAEDVAKYGRNKLSPFGGLAADAADRHDYAGNTVPYSSEKPRYKDSHRLGYGEYASSHLPIFVSDAISEVWKSQGMSDSQIKSYLNGLMTAAVVGGTGARLSSDVSYPNSVKKH